MRNAPEVVREVGVNDFPAKRHRNSKRNRTAALHAKKFHGTRCQACKPEFVKIEADHWRPNC